ncbi:MAG TPA: response regulator [Bradyrhizobium sp.]|uniref:ATP-binding response regulator n=1 Tax=Bradyrhizobium sp. TaxID=376 RepID=UPI002B490D9D|nr:response regulator [Bradyrhizobium sp.]HKO70199.1 response regulator [Bradyrhizobium sp.]
MSRLTIRARLIILSGALLCMLIATNLYLTNKLANSSAAVAHETELSSIIESANNARIAFGEMRYWLTDLAVSLLTPSETNAAAARARMDDYLEQLALRKPKLVAAVRAERNEFENSANEAVDRYTNDQRVLGNSKLAQARDHSVKVDELLGSLNKELREELTAERNQIVENVTTATRRTLAADLLIVALGVLLTFVILRSIAIPMRQLIGAIDGLSAGNLAVSIPPASPDEIGTMAHTLGLFRDSLKERDRFAAEAEAQRKTIAAAIATISEGFVLYDAEDRMVLFNDQFRAIYPGLADLIKPGTKFDEVLNAVVSRSLVDLGRQTPEEWLAERRARHQHSGGFAEYRYGGRFVRISERRIQGGGTVAVYSDITELRTQNLELEEARELSEVANRTKSQFLANMSHELRTPLNAIIGYSEILQEDAVDNGQEQLVPDLKKIEGAGRHLLGLINDILDLSKVEAGKMDVFIEEIDLSSLLDEVKSIIAPLVAKNGNELEVRLADHVGKMRSDRTKLKQCLLNVLSNASKFTQDGKLTVQVRRFETDGPKIEIVISDTGIGMNEDQIGRLFQAFSQADASTTKKFGGTGLGLAITRHFCRLLGGDISVASQPGVGSSFTIVLPDQAAEPESLKPVESALEAPRSTSAGSTVTVLVVDDDPAARDLLTTNLGREGYRTVQARGGDEALELARKLRPDAITLDVLMPKKDGWTVLGALKADPVLRDIPVVMVTVAPDRGIGLSLGAAEVMTKPVDRGQLTALLRQLLSRDGPILVVEDDLATRETVRHTVEKLGLTVAEVTNGRLALTWLAENSAPALILLDLMMPEMDGFEFLDTFNRRPDWRHIPVVVITAKQLTAAERALLAGRTRIVIRKGASMDTDVADAIRKAVGQRGKRRPDNAQT